MILMRMGNENTIHRLRSIQSCGQKPLLPAPGVKRAADIENNPASFCGYLDTVSADFLCGSMDSYEDFRQQRAPDDAARRGGRSAPQLEYREVAVDDHQTSQSVGGRPQI